MLGLVVAAVGGPLRSSDTGNRVLVSGVALAACLAPLGLYGHASALVLAVLTLIGAGVAARRRSLAPLVAAEAILALGAYLYNYAVGYPRTSLQEAGLIGILALAAVSAAAGFDHREGRIAAGLAVWGLATRLAIIGLDLPPNASITVAWLAVCAAFLVLGFTRKLPELRQLGLGVAAITAAKVVLIDLGGLDAALKAAVLLGLGIVLLAGGYAYVRTDRLKGNLGE
jgi:uncharacterized membrane protein